MSEIRLRLSVGFGGARLPHSRPSAHDVGRGAIDATVPRPMSWRAQAGSER